MGHYSNEHDDEVSVKSSNKKGLTSFLVKDNIHDSSSKD